MNGTSTVLVCDDNVDHLMLMRRELEKLPDRFRVATVTSAAACLQELERRAFDVVIIDYLLRDRNGLDLLREVTGLFPATVAIMITGMGNEDVAVQAMKGGADDYVIKSTGSFAVVPLVITRALERRALLESKRELERQASQAGQLSLLGRVALGVAHDVNELLGTIQGRIQLARTPGPDAARRSHLDVAETAARDAELIVRRIMDFSGPAPARVGEPLSLARVADDCLEFTRSRWEADAQRRGVAYELIRDVPADLTVEGTAVSLREIITNLVVNALDAMPDGGTLILRGQRDAGLVRLSIQDTGIGMDREQASRVFDLMFTGGKPGGHGIGLATCRALVEGMGGRIEVQSERNVGTTFTLVLAAGAEAGDATGGGRHAGLAADGAGAPAGQRVLVVDDEPRVADLMRDILAAARHKAEIAYGGEEAMSKFKPASYDILFCDLSLPGKSGLEVVRAVRALDASVAIVLVTGWGNEESLAPSEPGLVDLVATKPLDVERVRALVAQAGLLARGRRAAGDGQTRPGPAT